jgi:hypothetical protein
MTIIQVQVGKNIFENVFINEGQLKARPTPYHLRMGDQNMIKPLGNIKKLKIHIHGIPYITTFIVLKNSVVDSSYFMLLGKPWLRFTKVTHDWGNNVIIVQGNGIVRTIYVNKKLGVEMKRPQVLVCYDLMEGLTNEKEDMIFETELELFSIGTIII